MGCDIHASIEFEHKTGWFHVMDVEFLPRDYSMFACLVDGHTRDYEEIGGLVAERGKVGLPTSIDYDSSDSLCAAVAYADHTFSWLTPSEYRQALAHYRSKLGREPEPEWVALGAYLDTLEPHGAVRIVIGFDN